MNNTMTALVYAGVGELRLEQRPLPKIEQPGDAIVKVTRSTLCQSDLHIRNGAVPRAKPGVILGHEFTGVIAAVGPAVKSLRIGDRAAANCITFCGSCWFCRRGFINNCEQGGWELGCRIDGCQAEYVRVPFADNGLTKIPENLTDENALFVGDILSSGYFGAELCRIQPGDCVAVLGCGPVGLCALQCARLFGAAQTIAVDFDPSRRAVALQNGLASHAVDPRGGKLEEQIRQWTHGRGADGVIEAAGGADSFQTAWKIARPNGIVAVVAMYEQDQSFPLPHMYGKNLTFKTGGVDAVHCEKLLELLSAGRLDTNFLITHRAPLSQILNGYHIFENHLENCLKWVVTP